MLFFSLLGQPESPACNDAFPDPVFCLTKTFAEILYSNVITRVLSQRPNSKGSTYQVQPLTQIHQIKRQIVVKGRERFITLYGMPMEMSKVLQPMFMVQTRVLGLGTRIRVGGERYV
jgi:hypothetical protein